MAIQPSSLPPSAGKLPAPPSLLRWTVVALACAMAGVGVMLLIWPKRLPTATPLFWAAVIGVPLVAAAVVLLVPFWAYADLKRKATSWDAKRDSHVAEVFWAESRPIMLLAGAHRFSMDDAQNTASAVASGDVLLTSRPTVDKAGAVEARWFDAPPFTIGKSPADYDEKRQLATLDKVIANLLDSVGK